jgi:hypothetical protein
MTAINHRFNSVFFRTTGRWDHKQRKHITVQEITCSKCSRVDELQGGSGSQPKPTEFVGKYFQREGWVLGSTRAWDVCPSCVKKSAKANKPDKTEPTNVVPIQPQKDAPMTVTQLASPPPQPSKTDKRVIILKLEDCYLGEDKGYDAGHSDASVAKELNVPAKWVADVREELFGPALDPEAVKINGEIMALHVRFVALEKELREAGAKLNDLKARIAKR